MAEMKVIAETNISRLRRIALGKTPSGGVDERSEGLRNYNIISELLYGILNDLDRIPLEVPKGTWSLPFHTLQNAIQRAAKRTAEKAPCDGKVVEIDGKKYKLTEVTNG